MLFDINRVKENKIRSRETRSRSFLLKRVFRDLENRILDLPQDWECGLIEGCRKNDVKELSKNNKLIISELSHNNVNTESLLRNQYFALQKSDQSVYVPSSDSDLYNVKVVSRPVQQPHPDLFNQPEFQPFNPNVINGGNQIFNNSTRMQMLDSCKN